MKSLYRVTVAKGGAFASRNVFLSRNSNVATKVSTMASIRHNSSTSERVKATPWTPHSLKGSAPTHNSPSSLAKASKNGTTKRTAYIALGSNLGDRIEWIEKACNEMSARGIKVKRTSSLWETEPMYVVDQANFVNGACEAETTLEPLDLLDELQSIERALGRQKIIDKGPRNIDLDILLYEDEVIDHERLKVPHPGLFEREFVLRPLAELIPGKTLNPASPWKVTQDYLNALPPSTTPLTTLTPLSPSLEPLRALQPNRKTHVMAILNLTPDSFSDGGLHAPALKENTRSHHDGEVVSNEALDMLVNSFVQGGATIIDIGGQSSAPYAPDITSAEEISRTAPAIRRMATSKTAISIDTYRASVAEAAVQAGADIINDISAGLLDPEMLPTLARLGKTVCLMHMRGTPATMTKLTSYPDGLIPTIANELLARVAAAEEAGIRRWRIILDPGIGFAKTRAQNLEILNRLDELRDWPGLRGLPWLLGSSRKGFVGKITGVEVPSERTWGTAATVAAAIRGGADIVRVHDVREMAQAAKMSDAIWRV